MSIFSYLSSFLYSTSSESSLENTTQENNNEELKELKELKNMSLCSVAKQDDSKIQNHIDNEIVAPVNVQEFLMKAVEELEELDKHESQNDNNNNNNSETYSSSSSNHSNDNSIITKLNCGICGKDNVMVFPPCVTCSIAVHATSISRKIYQAEPLFRPHCNQLIKEITQINFFKILNPSASYCNICSQFPASHALGNCALCQEFMMAALGNNPNHDNTLTLAKMHYQDHLFHSQLCGICYKSPIVKQPVVHYCNDCALDIRQALITTTVPKLGSKTLLEEEEEEKDSNKNKKMMMENEINLFLKKICIPLFFQCSGKSITRNDINSIMYNTETHVLLRLNNDQFLLYSCASKIDSVEHHRYTINSNLSKIIMESEMTEAEKKKLREMFYINPIEN